jgi:tRNA G10  N-methylase Trm11
MPQTHAQDGYISDMTFTSSQVDFATSLIFYGVLRKLSKKTPLAIIRALVYSWLWIGDLNLRYLGVKETADKWGITRRRVQFLCNQNRIEGACKVGSYWAIPEDSKQPNDARLKVEPIRIPKNKNPLRIERIWSMPNKNTFEIKPIKALIDEEMTEGLWIDPFANSNKIANITNDLNNKFDTDYHLDALDFLKMFEDNSIDGVLYDPPYSPRQVSECYNNVGYNVTWDTTKASFWGNHKREISRIVKQGGKVITFGWNSGGIGMKYGFEISRILMVPHGGWHNDTLCTVETKQENATSKNASVELVSTADKSRVEVTETDKALVEALELLPDDYWDFKTEDTREFTHGLHSYPAMMVCPISRNIIKILKEIKTINSLFDPFSGSGTVLVEGMLAGIDKVCGNDMNPLALFLSKVKTTPVDMDELLAETRSLFKRIKQRNLKCGQTISDASSYFENELLFDLTAKDGWGSNAFDYLSEYCHERKVDISIPDFKNMGYWFKPSVILELSMIKEEIDSITAEDIRNFILTALSESVRLVSNRRNGEFKMFRMPPAKVKYHKPIVLDEFSKILQRNTNKMYDFLTAYDEVGVTSQVNIYNDNTCNLNAINDEEFDLVVTSPPYGDSRTTVAYGEFSRLSLQWLNPSGLSEREIMRIDRTLMGGTKYRNGFEYTLGSDTLEKSLSIIIERDMERAGDVFSFYNDLSKSISEISRVTKSGGYHFWVVGNRTVKDELLHTDIIIREMAANYGMQFIHSVGRNISNKVMPSLNSPTNETGAKSATMTNEHIVILRKV